MIKILILSFVAVFQVAIAAPRLICFNSGDMKGTYILDITGYEQILNGSQPFHKRSLGFKPFRSSVTQIAELSCAKPNPFLEGPGTLIACYSGPVRTNGDYGSHLNPYEAALFKNQSGLTLSIRGPGIPAGYSVSCQIKDL